MNIPSNVIAPEYSQRYISLVAHEFVTKALKKNSKKFIRLVEKIPVKKRTYAYLDGKWTIKEMLQHIIDAERVFALRALWFARKDISPLPGFDENTWAEQAHPDDRKWKDMVEEFTCLRKSTILLFSSFNEDDLNTAGLANDNAINVVALGYMCAGHVTHHMKIIRDRYLIE